MARLDVCCETEDMDHPHSRKLGALAACFACLMIGGCGTSSSATQGTPGGHPTPDAGNLATGDTYLPWAGGPAYYAHWAHGPSTDPNTFPIAVWLQSPSNAKRYEAIGVNLFIGLWGGPTDAQLAVLADAGMPVMAGQEADWADHLDDPTVEGWTQEDEPDNAQSDGNGGYLPCVDPSTIQSIYQTFQTNDPSRPVFLNLGQGVAWDDWYGRGTCTGDVDSYNEYVKGGDILSFDIYPVNSTDAAVENNPWMVAKGVDRLREDSADSKPVWVWLETTGINDPSHTPSPAQIRAETWMALVHGASGIGWFCHIMGPTFDETGLLDTPESKAAVQQIDAEIASLAPVLNTQSLANGATVQTSNSSVPVDLMVKRADGALYIFAVAMRPGTTTATFAVRGMSSGSVEVLGESRTLTVADGKFEDDFAADYAVHLYRVTP